MDRFIGLLALVFSGTASCHPSAHFDTRVPEQWHVASEHGSEGAALAEGSPSEVPTEIEVPTIRRSLGDSAFRLTRDFVFAWEHGAAERYLSEAPELGAVSGGRVRPLLPAALELSRPRLLSTGWTFHRPNADTLRAGALSAAIARDELIVAVEANASGTTGPYYLGLRATERGLRVSHLWTETGELP